MVETGSSTVFTVLISRLLDYMKQEAKNYKLNEPMRPEV